MSILATVLPVMIASPGDVLQFRNIAREVLQDWNYIHTNTKHLVLMPVGWETHSSPELGSSAQDLINERLLKDCDALIGIFWTRLGTPTASSSSGTVEEIQRHIASGKPALLYFCDQAVTPGSLDPKQYSALTDFRQWCQPKGLIETFSSEREFREKLRRHVQIALNDNARLRNIVDSAQRSAGENAAQEPSPSRYPSASHFRSSRTKARGKGVQSGALGVEDLALPDLEPVTMSEVGTKLDLARAYMDMGDPEGARNILGEVVAEGSTSQRRTAERLIESLPESDFL